MIYGDGINALCCMQGLIKRGVDARRIVWVRPNRETQEKMLDPEADKESVFPDELARDA